MRTSAKRSLLALLVLTVTALGIFLGRSLPGWLVTAEAGNLVTVSVTPAHGFRFSRMKVGVLQHVDREYTYDRAPDELLNGFLFQGIHRPPRGSRLTFTLHSPATVYFFFHHKVDGGYGKIFEGLSAWKRLETYPQYDIHNGDHGLTMVMYRLDAGPGVYSIPATTEDNACFNIVFVARAGSGSS